MFVVQDDILFFHILLGELHHFRKNSLFESLQVVEWLEKSLLVEVHNYKSHIEIF